MITDWTGTANSTRHSITPLTWPSAAGRSGFKQVRHQTLAHQILERVAINDADYYLFGPRPFLRAPVTEPVQAGVPTDRIYHEFFGPADELLAA